jgi:hypothetical protein
MLKLDKPNRQLLFLQKAQKVKSSPKYGCFFELTKVLKATLYIKTREA